MSDVPTLYLRKHDRLYRIKVIGKAIWCERQPHGNYSGSDNVPVCEVDDPRLKEHQVTDSHWWDLDAARIVLYLYERAQLANIPTGELENLTARAALIDMRFDEPILPDETKPPGVEDLPTTNDQAPL
ncbi:MAG: hypothetical protein ACYDBJ_20305 [Aggregatilineales bacterium]